MSSSTPTSCSPQRPPLRPLHRAALAVLNDWPNQGTILATSSQVLREYLAVATRPVAVNGLGLGTEDALANVTAFRGRMRLLVDSEPVWDRLQALVATNGCVGKQIHDANIVATALTSGVARLVTANAGDFNCFAADIEAIDLATLDPTNPLLPASPMSEGNAGR